ncbi:MAG: competence/damage-inducible protein A, partial [Snowella sp.]
ELAQLGIPHYYQTTVGDNPQRIHQVIATAIQRSSILIFTGGLGPTPDDLTTEAIADFFETPLIERPEIIADITEKFTRINRPIAENNYKQALLPQGADILANSTGTAPGLIWQPRPGITLLTFPGVPSEMKRMWKDIAVPYLKSQGWGKERIYSQVLRFRGIGESSLAEKVAPLFELKNPTVAPYAALGEVRLRVSSKATSEAEALEAIEPVAIQIREIAGLDYFGQDEATIASVVGKLLLEKGQTVSVAESCTGGGLGAMFTEIPGSSYYFYGGIIAYDNQAKIKLLGVNPEDIATFGAVSPEVAEQMALGVKQSLQTDWGLSITGIAGPEGGTESKPVGLVYLGIADPQENVESLKFQFGDTRGRSGIRYLSASNALDQLRRRLLNHL